MRKTMFFKMAAGNLKKNRQVYLPFILTLTGMAAIFDIMGALAVSPALDFMLGGGFMREILLMGERIVGIFSLIFLFYTNSFLLKRRKKEFGLYHILGMEKRHVALILVLELFYTVLLGLGLGLLAGTVFYKAVLLLLCRILHAPRILGFEFSVSAFTETVVLFGMVFFLLAIYGVRQIFRSETTELLKSNQTAEREPKNRWFLVLVGLVSLGAGYYLAVTIESPLGAIAYFFLAVVLVIIGTYCLFTAGSIFILKMLKKNKGYYYQSRHFTSVSGMLYRMKQNAAGLANICIMSTAVILIVSTTTCLYFGMDDLLRTRFPRNVQVTASGVTEEEITELEQLTADAAAQYGLSIQDNEENYRYRNFYAQRNEKTFTYDPNGGLGSAVAIYCLSLDDFNRITGQNLTLGQGEIFYDSVYGKAEKALEGTLTIQGKEWKMMGAVTGLDSVKAQRVMMGSIYYLIFPDQASIEELTGEIVTNGTWNYFMGIDLDGDSKTQAEMETALSSLLAEKDWGSLVYIEGTASSRENFYSLYGGIFFVGIFLGFLFLMATVLIIYYKQVSEGYEDHDRFVIMQKVGMDKREVRRTINSQVKTVFLLPVLAAGVHMVFAYPMMSKILLLMNLGNQKIFLIGVLLTFFIFLAFYGLVYFFTARTYYRLVRW